MKKPLLLSLIAATILTTNLTAESMFDRFEAMESEMSQLKLEIATLKAQKSEVVDNSQDKEEVITEDDDDKEENEEEELNVNEAIEELDDSISELNRATSGNHIKFNVDYRFAVENMQYKMADGSKEKNDAFMSNRFWLNMNWAATENLSFTSQLAYYKAFGARSGASGAGYETFDWIANENAFDDTVRVRSVYFLYRNDTFLGSEIPWTFSVGRRPSTSGHLVNFRDDEQPSSPMAHTINVEFDGASAKFSFDDLVEGMYFKLCAGRGMSSAAPKFSPTPYAGDTTPNTDIDLAGLIFTPYDNGQYSVSTQYYYADNLIDATNPIDPTAGFDTVGGLHSATINFVSNGIGDEWSDFLDETIFFVSGAISVTDPDDDQRMLYAQAETGESKTGYSYWAGTQFPSLFSEDGRWGLEYNKGTKYWRSITYGEDTNIGSKLAARGNAYEAYFTEYLVEDILSLQVRYTYIDYEFSGSNGFFGSTTGTALDMDEAVAFGQGANVVETAQDIRFYLRYRY